MINIVIPMAGRGSRFVNEGYELPKPLISIHGEPMIKVVCQNLKPSSEHRFIFLCLREHIEIYAIDKKLRSLAPGCEIVIVDQVTEGAACTVLLAKDLINSSDPLMIANSDQWVDIEIDDYLAQVTLHNLDGLIMTMWANDPKWSFVRLSEAGKVIEVVEKEVVSNEATVGIYNFTRGRDFVLAAEKMIARELRVNGEFYVAPVYNQLIEEGALIKPYSVGSVDKGMYGLGTPDDLNSFLAKEISNKPINAIKERKLKKA